MLSRTDLSRLVSEAQGALAGALVHRIWREGDETFVLLCRVAASERDRLALEIGLRPEGARVVTLTAEDVAADDAKEKKARKADSHFFLAWLRKTLPGCRVVSISSLEDDRVAFVDFLRERQEETAREDDEGEESERPGEKKPERLRLAIELTGRATNLVLLEVEKKQDEPETAKVLVALRPGRAGRELDPGTPYARPKPRAPKPGEAPAPEPVFEPEIEPSVETLALSRAVREAALAAEDELDQGDRRGALLKTALAAEKRARGLVAKLEKEREEAREAEEIRQRGELLKANASRVKRGQTKITVQDYFSQEPREVEIEIDPLLPVMDQARALFKRAKKLDRGLVAIETRLGETDAQAEAIAKVRSELEASSPEDEAALDRAERALEKLGLKLVRRQPLEQKPKKKRQEDEPRGPRKFDSRGFTILVGRSNEENDRLTLTVARGNDLFFHVRGFPGSHVIVRTERDKSVPLETLLDAAALAVHYSKVRGNTRADVSYTPRKYVRKPRGAKPGLVEISNEKTIRPDGDPARLARLLATAHERETDELEDVG